jgi:phosphohistidine phosphatase
MKSASILPPDRKQLLLCRHAKSSWNNETLSDFDRPLNKRGERDAPEMGRRLAQQGMRPDLIMTSPAVRARATAEYLAARLGYPQEKLKINSGQYAATVAALLAFLRALEPCCGRVMMVGHNPEFTALANLLGNLDIGNIPTCGIVALEFPVTTWKEVTGGSGKLLFFDFPKNVL